MTQTPEPDQPLITKAGKPFTDADAEALSREAEMGYEWHDDGRVDAVANILLATTDAAVWAHHFQKQFRLVTPDEYTMLTWFANAIETGRNQGRTKSGEATLWREPAEETEGYPNLVVHDGRVTGQITIGPSRLPVSAILSTAVAEDWDSVEEGWSPTGDYGFTEDDLLGFLHDLLQARGEFGRLLLALADAERVTDEREHAVLDAYADADGMILVKTWPPGPDTVELPAPWWEVPELRRPVVEALTRCLAALTDA